MDSDVFSTLTNNVIAFLMEFGYLDDPKKEPGFDKKGLKAKCDVIYSVIGRMTEARFQKLPLKYIGKRDNYNIVDIGSGLGIDTTLKIAKVKPYTHLYLVDNLDRGKVRKNHRDFCKKRIQKLESVEDWINRMLKDNGYENVTYVHMFLRSTDGRKTNLECISEELIGSKTIFTGYKNPAALGNITAQEAIYFDAETLFISNSALERISPKSSYWSLMRDFYKRKLSPKETKKLISLIYDPLPDTCCGHSQYAYGISTNERFCHVLKLAFVLTQVDYLQRNGYDVDIYRKIIEGGWWGDFNKPDHFLVANKTSIKSNQFKDNQAKH